MKIFSRAAAALGSLWPLGRISVPPPDDSPEVVDGWTRIHSGDELLSRPEVAPFVQKIKANFRGTPSQAFELLDIPLDRCATLVQLLPAAEYYHHPERGGLLFHMLECMAMATDANYQIHQMVDPRLVKDNTPPEFIFYTNYCFHLRALTHDIGKLQTLFNIELRIERPDGSFSRTVYDPMDGGFGALCMAGRAEREKDAGARSVRYRYYFKRGDSIQEHELYWQTGVQRLLQHLPNPVPGQHFCSTSRILNRFAGTSSRRLRRLIVAPWSITTPELNAQPPLNRSCIGNSCTNSLASRTSAQPS